MNYYILNSENEIVLFDTNKSRLQNTLKFKPELADEKIHQTTKEIIELDGHFVFADEHTDELLEKAKADKLAELNTISGQYDQYKCDVMYITSSVEGLRFNADIRSQTNIQGLLSTLQKNATVTYKDYDNNFVQLNAIQLSTIYNECITNGQNLYAQKWSYQSKIEACTSIDEVNAIEIAFEMMDFSNSDIETDSNSDIETDSE
jgi:hypothetical protein